MSPNLLKVISRSFIFGLGAIAVLALLPLVARDFIRGSAITYGLLLGSFGIGAISGALMNTRMRETFSNETIAQGAFLGFALSAILVALSQQTWLTCLCLIPAGACWVLALSLFNVTVQLSTPRWVVGRTLSIYQTATFGGMAVGSWLWGIAAEAYGPTAALLGSGAVLTARCRDWPALCPAGIWCTEPRSAQSVQGALPAARSEVSQRADHDHDRL